MLTISTRSFSINIWKNPKYHCMKSVRIRSFSGPYFLSFGHNTNQKNSEYGHFSRSVNLYYIYNVSIRSLVMEKIIAEILSKLRKMIFSVNCFRGDFWDFLAPLTKFSFWGTSWELCLNCKHFRNFLENFLFLKIPRTIGNLWDNSYIYSILIVI